MNVTHTYTINRMACPMCVANVKKALEAFAGISVVEVSLSDKTATVTYDDSQVTPQQMQEAIKAAGYDMML